MTTKLTVNLLDEAVAALDLAQQLSQDNRTDIVNRALQFYSLLLYLKEQGKLIFAEDPINDTRERIFQI